MKKILSLILVIILCASCAAFADGASDAEVVYARVASSNGEKQSALYVLPGEYRPVVTYIPNGTQIIVLFEGSSWHKVQVANNSTEGWMKASEVSITTRGLSALNFNSTLIAAKTVKSSDGYAALRWGAGLQYDIMDNLPNGTYLWVFESENGWSRVLIPGGRVGYVASNLLTSATRLAEWPIGMYGYVQVSGNSANFRDNSNYSSNVIGQLYSGDIVMILGDYNGFLKVTDGTRDGYLSHDIISPSGINRLVYTAPMYYDNPAVYGSQTDVLWYVPSGTTVKVLATDGYVSRIEYNGADGFVYDNTLVY